MSVSETICISEIFGPTIQGEGAFIGLPTVFVRTGGCDYHCSWCDTVYAVENRFRKDWTNMSAEKILKKVHMLSGERPLLVSLSGGNPALQPLGRLLDLGKSSGFTFGLETQGSVAKDWFSKLDFLTLSPKPPSSGMATDWQKLQECIEAAGKALTTLKFVLLDEADYLFAREIAAKFPALPVYLQPCNHTPPNSVAERTVEIEKINERMLWIVERVIADAWFTARVLPQLHVILWGNKRGV